MGARWALAPWAAMVLVAGTALAGLAGASAARAEGPSVVTDIAPVQSLAATVMEGVGTPTLILPPGASPHGYAMRPSEAASLQDADIVFWVGPALAPWLARAIDNLAPDALVVELMAVKGVKLLASRVEHAHIADGHGHIEAHDGHDNGLQGRAAVDPHVWLDPVNGIAWLDAMATALSEADPANAERYRANAEAGQAALQALTDDIAARLAPVAGLPFVVRHDAFHYFEHRFDLGSAGAIALGDAVAPGPARLAEVVTLVRDRNVTCVFTEPQFDEGLAETVAEGSGARIVVLDPLGTALEPGPALYGQLLDDMADTVAGCLSGSGAH